MIGVALLCALFVSMVFVAVSWNAKPSEFRRKEEYLIQSFYRKNL